MQTIQKKTISAPDFYAFVDGIGCMLNETMHLVAWRTYGIDDHTFTIMCGFGRNGVTRFRPASIKNSAIEEKICTDCLRRLDEIKNKR